MELYFVFIRTVINKYMYLENYKHYAQEFTETFIKIGALELTRTHEDLETWNCQAEKLVAGRYPFSIPTFPFVSCKYTFGRAFDDTFALWPKENFKERVRNVEDYLKEKITSELLIDFHWEKSDNGCCFMYGRYFIQLYEGRYYGNNGIVLNNVEKLKEEYSHYTTLPLDVPRI